MKKEYILYGVIAVLVLWIAVLLFDKFSNSDDENYFRNNLECQKYLEDFKEEFPYSNHSIFYSPRENACIWVFRNDFIGIIRNIVNLFDKDNKYAFYSWYADWENKGAVIHSYFTDKECSGLDCKIEDYETLIKERDEEIEWLKWK